MARSSSKNFWWSFPRRPSVILSSIGYSISMCLLDIIIKRSFAVLTKSASYPYQVSSRRLASSSLNAAMLLFNTLFNASLLFICNSFLSWSVMELKSCPWTYSLVSSFSLFFTVSSSLFIGLSSISIR